MLLANIATYALSHVPNVAVWMFQEGGVGWDPVSLWKQMGILAKTVVIILFIMSGWSIGVMTMKMISRTNITSTIGVTLMLEFTFEPSSRFANAMVQPPRFIGVP